MDDIRKEFLKSENGRKWFIEKTVKAIKTDTIKKVEKEIKVKITKKQKDKLIETAIKKANWQSFHTPYYLCKKMIQNTGVKNKSILVLFNIEFLEVLINNPKFGVLSKNITFLADCRLESEMATKIYEVETVIINGNNTESIQEVLKEMKNFDLCFSNPPYTDRIDLNIMKELNNICNEMIIVHGANWLIERRRVDDLINYSLSTFANILKSSIIFNSVYSFEEAKLLYPCVISHIDKNKQNETPIDVNYFGQIFKTTNIDNITIFGSSWEPIVLPFKQKIETFIKNSKYGSLCDHALNLDEIDRNKSHCQLASVRGNNRNKNDLTDWFSPQWKDDFYTLLIEDGTKNKGIRKESKYMKIFEFDGDPKRDNFISYLKTNFARFCLMLSKAGTGIGLYEIVLIPYLDFQHVWTDYELYSCFNIPKTTISYIESFLPVV